MTAAERCCPSLPCDPVCLLCLNFIPLEEVLLFTTALSLSTRSLEEINRWHRDARSTCARTHENESRSITANCGCWQQYILSRRFNAQWFIAESQRLTRWIQNAFERNFIRTHSCCIQIVSAKACLYNLTTGNLTMQLSSTVNIWQALSLILLLQVHAKLTQGHE